MNIRSNVFWNCLILCLDLIQIVLISILNLNHIRLSCLLLLLNHFLDISLIIHHVCFLLLHSFIISFVFGQSLSLFSFFFFFHFDLFFDNEMDHYFKNDHDQQKHQLWDISWINSIVHYFCYFFKKVVFIGIWAFTFAC